MPDRESDRPEPRGIEASRRRYSAPEIAWIEMVEVRRNLAAACAKTEPFACSDNPAMLQS